MDKIKIGEFDVIDISEKEMADYFSRAFSHPAVKSMLLSSQSLLNAENDFCTFGNILQAYASATGDLSNETIELFAKDFEKNRAELRQRIDGRSRLDAKQLYFGKHIMPKIQEIHCQRMGIKEPLSWKDLCRVIASIETQSNKNTFMTHSFNGALLEDIKKNGLDITRELFKDEFALLKTANMQQSYQTGNLLFCDLSHATFGYALRAPERLLMSVKNGVIADQSDYQSNSSFLTQVLLTSLNNNRDLPSGAKMQAYQAGKKMIDFYFGSDHPVCIAFKKNHGRASASDPKKYEPLLGAALMAYSVTSGISLSYRKAKDTQMQAEHEGAMAHFRQTKDLGPLSEFATHFAEKYPDNPTIRNAQRDFMIDTVTCLAVNHFVNAGISDGRPIPGGKLTPDQFSLAVFPNPVNAFVNDRIQKREKAQEATNSHPDPVVKPVKPIIIPNNAGRGGM